MTMSVFGRVVEFAVMLGMTKDYVRAVTEKADCSRGVLAIDIIHS